MRFLHFIGGIACAFYFFGICIIGGFMMLFDGILESFYNLFYGE